MGGMKVDVPLGVPEFYKGRSIFVTGFTGAIGKVIVEKLLYSCPDVKIYALVRSKKGQTPQQRIQKITSSIGFARVREKYGDGFESKVVGIGGDLLEDRLGLSPEDEELLRREVSIIIHGAASVRFDDPLKLAVELNTLGTKKIVDLALTMPHLVCLTYVSTAYTNCDNVYIKEEIYPAKADWRKTLEICEKIDPATISCLEQKFIGKLPNTYTLSKSLAEHVINDYRDKLPVVIVRPSIVCSAGKEPVPGWTDNIIGINGFGLGVVLGLIRCLLISGDERCNTVPSDVVVNCIILATCKKAQQQKSGIVEDSVTVYNSCSPYNFNGSFKDDLIFNNESLQLLTDEGIYLKNVVLTKSKWFYRIYNLFRHVLPSCIIDLLLVLTKRKPMLLKLRRKLYQMNLTIFYFTCTTWEFQRDNMCSLLQHLNSEDKESFGWDFDKINIFQKREIIVKSLKYTILKPLYDDLDKNRKMLHILYTVDRFSVYLTFSLVGFTIYYFNLPYLLLTSLKSFLTLT